MARTRKKPLPAPEVEPVPPASAARWWWLRTAIAVILIATAYFYQLDRPLLWDDEADTGVFARNTLHLGVPAAYDGRNVAVYASGDQLNHDLLSKRTPWVQYYVGALSLTVFGDGTAGLRAMFALAGLLAFVPIHAVLKQRSRYPEVLATLALISPQVVLFHRNARYYSLLTLLYALLVWHVSAGFRKNWVALVSASAIMVLLFHTHTFAAGCCAVSLIVFCLLWRRNALVLYTSASCIGFASWLAWYVLLGASARESTLFVGFMPSVPGVWIESFLSAVKASVMDLDAIGCLPALLCFGIAVKLFLHDRGAARKQAGDPVLSFVLVSVLIQVVLTSALLGTESAAHYSFLRYQPHLIVFSLLAGFIILGRVVRNPAIHLAVCVSAICLNLFSLSFWAQPSGPTVPVSWMQAVYSEIIWPRDSAWEQAVATLRAQPQGMDGPQTLMLGVPAWTQGILLFYVGDKYLVRPILNAPFEGIAQALKDVLGETSAARLSGNPEWVVDSLNALRAAPPGYVELASIPSYRTRPDDGARPELTRHAFAGSETTKAIRLFHFQ